MEGGQPADAGLGVTPSSPFASWSADPEDPSRKMFWLYSPNSESTMCRWFDHFKALNKLDLDFSQVGTMSNLRPTFPPEALILRLFPEYASTHRILCGTINCQHQVLVMHPDTYKNAGFGDGVITETHNKPAIIVLESNVTGRVYAFSVQPGDVYGLWGDYMLGRGANSFAHGVISDYGNNLVDKTKCFPGHTCRRSLNWRCVNISTGMPPPE